MEAQHLHRRLPGWQDSVHHGLWQGVQDTNCIHLCATTMSQARICPNPGGVQCTHVLAPLCQADGVTSPRREARKAGCSTAVVRWLLLMHAALTGQ